ncbi:hypothetical protein HWV62_17996 [Athelia sp. TMB]|nr:hypothetical protein HWV62_17996 [Athelia sp. TMB]
MFKPKNDLKAINTKNKKNNMVRLLRVASQARANEMRQASSYAGRSRQSIADIEQHLVAIFTAHPQSHTNDAGDPVIPADALVDVLRAFSDSYDEGGGNDGELMTEDEMDMLKMLLASNPGLEVTPATLLAFIAEKTKQNPEEEEVERELDPDSERGRTDGSDSDERSSRSSSRGSRGSGMTASRPPSVPPKTPTSTSKFDTTKRQRNSVLAPPSSFSKRPVPASRRKSIDSALSDGENSSPAYTSGRRSRASSNGGSMSTPGPPVSFSGAFSAIGSPPYATPSSRPGSRPGSRGSSYGTPFGQHFPRSPESPDGLDFSSISTMPMPRPDFGAGSDQDDSDSDSDPDVVHDHDRTTTSSSASLEPQERLDALQRANAELGKKLMDAERTLQNRLADHEGELEEYQAKVEELRGELSATKREEKELRGKERQNSTQISALESEIAKLQKSLDNARASYQSLQKQYQEQCAESERYRNNLRRKDAEIKDHVDAAALQALELHKYLREHDTYEERLAQLEAELGVAQQAHTQLDEQKQENLMLKETIDRMRFDMDEMRNNAASASSAAGGGPGSAAGSMSKSLGAELLGKMGDGDWDEVKARGRIELEEETSSESEVTVVETASDGEETEGEDVVQTIITRKKRKVPGRANVTTVSFEELKEYSDAWTQHEIAEFSSSMQIQTEPEPIIPTASFSMQTDPPPLTACFEVQTDPEPAPPAVVEMEIQTEPVEEARAPSPSPEPEEHMASSSSTVSPPTPKPSAVDLPPTYHQVTEQDQDDQKWRVAAETLKHWHLGAAIPFEAVPGGVTEETLEQWKALQEELGVGCMVIDKVLAASEKIPEPPRSVKDGKRKSKFYNIYNTYFIGHGKDGEPSRSSFQLGVPAQIALCISVSAFVMLALVPYAIPHYAVPGAPTYYDRRAWAAFNSMQATGEGFSTDGAASIFNFLGRVGGGAAKMARSWPT